MSDWFNSLPETWAMAWSILSTGAKEPGSGTSLLSLATLGPEGPELRTVVLRSADSGQALVTFHTDAQSHKVDQLRIDPQIAGLVWSQDDLVQIRFKGRIALSPGPAPDWDALPHHSRLNYGSTPPPGSQIPGPSAYVKAPDPSCYLHCTITLTSIDTVYLGRGNHRRALFQRKDGWQGSWRAP